MKLHSPSLETALRRGVKRTIRGSPALKREYRRSRKVRRHYSGLPVLRVLLTAIISAAVGGVAETTGHPPTALAVISLWGAAGICFQTLSLFSRLYASTDLHALHLLPVTDAEIFRWELQKFFRRSLFYIVDFLAGFVTVGVLVHFSTVEFLAVIPLAALSWLLLLALVGLCATRLPKFPYPMIVGVLSVLMLLLFAAHQVIGPAVLAALDHGAPFINLFLPSGWAPSLFQLLLPNPNLVLLLLVVPGGALVWTIGGSLARLRGNYRFLEGTRSEAADLVPDQNAEILPAAAANSAEPRRVGLTAIQEIIESRQFLSPPSWDQRGWLEKILWRWLNAREKVLADMVFPSGLSLTVRWLKLFRNLAVAAVVGFAAGYGSPFVKFWIIAIAIFVSIVLTLALVFDSGRMFQKLAFSGVIIPLYAGFATGLRELSGLQFKCSAVQIPPLLACTTVCGMLLTHLMDLPVTDGIMYGLKAGCLIFASRFIVIVFGFSSGTNDTSGFRLRTAALMISVAVLGILFLGLGASGLLVPAQAAWILVALAMLDACVLFRVYAWFYHANCFDLMNQPRR